MRITTRREDHAAKVSLEGSLDATWCGEFERAVEALLREGAREVEVGCAQVSFVSSAGMGSLLRMHRVVRSAGGNLRLVEVGESVMQPLRLMKLESLLLSAPVVATAAVQDLRLQGLRMRVRALGGSGFGWKRTRALPSGEPVRLGASDVMLGVGCLGHRPLQQAGELVGFGCMAASLPAGGGQADLLVDAAEGPALTLLDAACLRGRAAEHAQFEALQGPVPLERLLRVAVERAGGAVCVVLAAELEGAVGASARRSPGEPDFTALLATAAGARRSLRWIGTPSFRGDLMLAVAVAAPAGSEGPWRDFMRPHGEGLLAHAHGVVAPYRPLPLQETDLGAVARAALDGVALRTVMHLVRDGRGEPAVQTSFRRGVLWWGPLVAEGAA